MQVQENVSLRTLNTFGIDTVAQYFTVLDNMADLPGLAATSAYGPKRVLGGGSNILLTAPVPGLLIANRLKGISILEENEDHVWLEVASGEVWHELVMYTIAQGWSGLENLALIPGTAGAAPMQNIGAYGVEAKDVISAVRFYHWEQQKLLTYTAADCHFGYRDSIFKTALKDQCLITGIILCLHKQFSPNIAYGAIAAELEQMQVSAVTAAAVAEAVIRIRSSKLPDPKQIGNAGSFFKNPTVTLSVWQQLQQRYPAIPAYKVTDDMVKIPAGWLIEQAGWKGYRHDDAGVHAQQALVLVNYGKATGSELWALSGEVVTDVNTKFGITLEREVQVW